MSSLLDALGYIGSSLDKPGAAVRGMLTGDLSAAKNLVPFSDAMGLTDESQRVSGQGLLQHYGLQDEGDDSLGGSLAGIGAEIATNPLSYVSGGALGKALGLGSRAAEGGGAAASPLMQARRGLAVAKGVDETGNIGRIVGGTAESRAAAPEMAKWLGELIPDGFEGGFGKIDGVPAIAMKAGANGSLARHELVHGLVSQAAQTGDGAGMPALVRLAANVYGPNNPGKGLRAGAGMLLDELAAQSLENRGVLNQVKGGARWLFGGQPGEREAYQQLLSQASPAVGNLYAAMPYVPIGAAGAVGLGTAIGGAAYASQP